MRRIVRLLGHTGQVEVEQVIRMSMKVGDITTEEVLAILKDLSGNREMKDVAFVW